MPSSRRRSWTACRRSHSASARPSGPSARTATISLWRTTTSVRSSWPRARDRRAADARRVDVRAAGDGDRGGDHHPRVEGEAVALRHGEQRPAGREPAGEQALEQVAPLAVGVGDEVLLVLDVGTRGVGAGEVAVAHQRSRQRERGLVAGATVARDLDHRLPEHLLADAEGVDVVLQREARAPGAWRRRGRTRCRRA
jgi:hypothetical protein